ncbi:hypothetical protein G6045_09730 [Streptomyces sp. YC504]|uniref:Carboxypeptidase regulatory-like domain-containing protein n=1 Tax=Streptomyces mesophilus TaxID=1775132 RepID=A0A6G4XGH7_9ACTN|nr:hypothetical protein [Streptomyces mesophilus]NGO75950.1 hypothetical protein [Streptomyces mesophilus]
MSAALAEVRRYRPLGIFDVRDRYLEQQRGDGLAATVRGRVRFAVVTVVTPEGASRPAGWSLVTRPTLSGLAVFQRDMVEDRPPRVVHRLSPTATSVELRVSCSWFQTRDFTFRPGTGQRHQIDLEPAIDYPFAGIPARAGTVGPAMLRGAVRDDTGRGVAGAVVQVTEGGYRYSTGEDGAWVVTLMDDLPWTAGRLAVRVRVTPPPGYGPPPAGPSVAVTALRGATVSVPDIRLRLS